jgi:hypothetical protein
VALTPAALAAAVAAARAAATTLHTAQPPMAAALTATVPTADPRLPLTLAILAAAVAPTLPAGWRRSTVLFPGALILLALPAALHLPWWSAPALDLAGVAAALWSAARYVSSSPTAHPAENHSPPSPAALVYAGELAVALTLTLHGVIAAFGSSAVAAATLGALSALGAGLTVLTRRRPRRLDLGGPGVFVSLLTLPAVAWLITAALTSSALTQSRVALAATVLPAAACHLIGRRWADLRPFVLAATVIPPALAPLWAHPAGDSTAIYAAVSLLTLATVAADRASWFAGLLPAAAFLTAAAGPLARILLIAPAKHTPGIPTSTPIAFLLLTAAATVALALWTAGKNRQTGVLDSAPPRTGRDRPGQKERRAKTMNTRGSLDVAAPLLALTATFTLAAANVRWPYFPAAELLLGLAGLLTVALSGPAPTPARNAAHTSVALRGPARNAARAFLALVATFLGWAGLAALLLSRPSAIAALGAVMIAAAVAGAAGRTLLARLAGWLTAVAAGIGVEHNVTRMVTTDEAIPLLGLAAATLALAWLLHRRNRGLESRAVEAAAHAVAVLSLLQTGSRPAVTLFVWGAALGIRALRRDHRDAYLVAAAATELAGWSALMLQHHVGVVEAYSIPAAALALLAGLLTRRRRSGLGSWTAYGPALTVALLPSLTSIAGSDGQYPRRLILGLAALAILLAGARARLQAPVVVGGSALVLVALHELAQVWDLVPRWIPLAAGGLLLVVLATTLERRRRDFDRLRASVARMT